MADMVIDGHGYPYLDGYPLPVNHELPFLACQMTEDQTSFRYGVANTSFDHAVTWYTDQRCHGQGFMDGFYTLAGTPAYLRDDANALMAGMQRGVAFMLGAPLFLHTLRNQVDFTRELEPQLTQLPHAAYPSRPATYEAANLHVRFEYDQLPAEHDKFMRTATVLNMLFEAWLVGEREFLEASKGVRGGNEQLAQPFSPEEWDTIQRGIIAGTALAVLWFRYEKAQREMAS